MPAPTGLDHFAGCEPRANARGYYISPLRGLLRLDQVKAKFGDRRSKTRTAQINEALCKVLAHNLCCLIQSIYELGIEPTFWEEVA
jgi:hypothetical protein